MDSTTAKKVKILGKEYPVRFGFKFQKIYMDHIGTNKIADYQKSLQSLEKMDTTESWQALGYFVLAAIQAASKKPVDIDPDDIVDDLIINGDAVAAGLMEAFAASQPVASNPDAVGKSKAGLQVKAQP